MKTKTLFTLYAVATALALGVLIAKVIQNSEENSSTKFARGYKPFNELAPGDIAKIELKDAEQSSTIEIKDGKWTVAEREGYPVNLSSLQKLIRKINDLTITQSLEAGASFDPRFGMDQTSNDSELHGTHLTLKKADGSLITSLKLGKEVAASGQQDPMAMMMGRGNSSSGRYIRLQEDPEGVYVVSDSLGEALAHPKDWLSKEFIKIENITSVSLSPAGAPSSIEWKVSRPDASADFTLEGGIPEGKELNKGVIDAFKNILRYAGFEDVISQSAFVGLADQTKTRRAVITTADNFTYTLDITPKDAEGASSKLLTVSVTGDLITTRVKKDNETEEQAKQAQEAFDKSLKEKKAQLKLEQSLAGKIYDVTDYTVQALLKSRSDFLKEPAKAD